MSRSPYANVFFYFRGPSTLGTDGASAPQLENNTTKALVNLLEHADPVVVVSWLGLVGIDAGAHSPVEFFVQGGPATVDASVRRLVVITAGDGPNDAGWVASTAYKGRVDAAVYVPGEALAVVESKVGVGLDGGQLDKHAADWGIARAEELTARDVPDAWVFTTWGDMHQWSISLAKSGSVGEVSCFLLSQFAEYLELIDVTPFAGFREDDVAYLAARRSALTSGGRTELPSDPLQGERLKNRLSKLWEAIYSGSPGRAGRAWSCPCWGTALGRRPRARDGAGRRRPGRGTPGGRRRQRLNSAACGSPPGFRLLPEEEDIR